MRIFLCAGESSSDLHGANLIRALRKLEPEVECEGLGGRQMQQAGMLLRHDLAGRGIMGFVEVLRTINYVRKLFLETVGYLAQHPPDVLVVIDYPGFNIRLAKRAHALGIPVVYYISPQVWAWKKNRIHTIGQCVKKVLTILPFEKALYDEAGVPCTYVGHPLVDHIESLTLSEEFVDNLVIGIMPGSRAQEIRRILPEMLRLAEEIQRHHPEARFIAPCVDEERAEQIRAIKGAFPLEIAVGRMYDVLHGARFCLVASGTATVETALFEVPMIVMYKAAWGSYWLARLLIDKSIKAIAMVNILAGRHIVPEFIQHQATADRMLPVALELIEDTPRRRETVEALRGIRAQLHGGASEKAAREILEVAYGG